MAILLGKDAAPAHPDQLKGRKTRVFGDTMQNFVSAMGGEVAQVSASKQYKAYEHGEFDFAMTGVTSVKSRKLYEVMDHLVKTNHSAIELVVVINEALRSAISSINLIFRYF